MSAHWRYLRGVIVNRSQEFRPVTNARGWTAWTIWIQHVAQRESLYRAIYDQEVIDNYSQSSTEDEGSMAYSEYTSNTDEPTQSSIYDSGDDDKWWDTQEELEKAIAMYACGNRPLTGTEKDVLLVIRQYVQG